MIWSVAGFLCDNLSFSGHMPLPLAVISAHQVLQEQLGVFMGKRAYLFRPTAIRPRSLSCHTIRNACPTLFIPYAKKLVAIELRLSNETTKWINKTSCTKLPSKQRNRKAIQQSVKCKSETTSLAAYSVGECSRLSRLLGVLYAYNIIKQESLLTSTAQRAACETWNAYPSC